MKRIVFSVFVLLAAALAGVSQTPKAHKHQIVMEVNVGPAAWKDVVGHVGVLRSAFGNDVQLEVVCLGEGLAMLNKSDKELEAAIRKAADAGVVFAACQNSMKKRKVTTEDLFPFAHQVPSGLAEVVLKQEDGYSYLKVAAE